MDKRALRPTPTLSRALRRVHPHRPAPDLTPQTPHLNLRRRTLTLTEVCSSGQCLAKKCLAVGLGADPFLSIHQIASSMYSCRKWHSTLSMARASYDEPRISAEGSQGIAFGLGNVSEGCCPLKPVLCGVPGGISSRLRSEIMIFWPAGL